MPNSYFQFKQFIIHQEKTTMKVTTDACLFGAWAEVKNTPTILDIGTGTGVLALMLAQKTDFSTKIHAVEIDKNSFEQAKKNSEGSPWKERIDIFHQKIQDFNLGYKYDFIICNPPFFKNHLTSPNSLKNQALHQVSLSFEELLESIKRLLNPDGRVAILLPNHEMQVFQELAEDFDLYPLHQLEIYNTFQKSIFRKIIMFSQKKQSLKKESISIRDNTNAYTDEFKNLMEDFYLYL